MTHADVVVVGASFAGLSAAEEAARRGQRVVVLERRRSVDASVRTTGLLPPDAVDLLRPPPSVLGPRLDAIEACTTSGTSARFERRGQGFTATDTRALLRVLADRAASAGAELRFGTSVERVENGAPACVVTRGGERIAAALVIGADGARSRVGRCAGIDPPRGLLSGVERHLELAPHLCGTLPADACLLLFDRRIAPGYAAWIFRGAEGTWQAGVLGALTAGFRPDLACDAFLAWLRLARGMGRGRVVETRAGVVPAGGAIARCRRGHVILVGDAAGHVSALTAGGIGRAVESGRAAASWLESPREAERAMVRLGGACGGWRALVRRGLELPHLPRAGLMLAQARGIAHGLAERVLFRPRAIGRPAGMVGRTLA